MTVTEIKKIAERNNLSLTIDSIENEANENIIHVSFIDGKYTFMTSDILLTDADDTISDLRWCEDHDMLTDEGNDLFDDYCELSVIFTCFHNNPEHCIKLLKEWTA